MSTSQRTTTRRTALQSALTGLLVAGAASMLPSTTSAAPEPVSVQHDALTTLAQTDADFAAWYTRWQAKRDAARNQYEALGAQLDVDEKISRIISEREEARLDWQMLDGQLFFEVTVRHFPGIAPALRLAWLHAVEQYTDELSSCCSDGLEPW